MHMSTHMHFNNTHAHSRSQIITLPESLTEKHQDEPVFRPNVYEIYF